MAEILPLLFRAVYAFERDDGVTVELKDPDGLPTPKQLSLLNRAGCLMVVQPGMAFPLTRADAAGAVAEVRRIVGDPPAVPPLSPSSNAESPQPIARKTARRYRGAGIS